MNKIRKGDNVQVLKGKDRGKSGSVERVLPRKDKISVSGVNMVKRHVKKYGEVEGGIIELFKPINISNVALICPACKKPTRVGFLVKDKEKARICKLCKAEIGKGV